MKSVSDVYISLFGVLIKLTVKQCPFNILSVLNAYCDSSHCCFTLLRFDTNCFVLDITGSDVWLPCEWARRTLNVNGVILRSIWTLGLSTANADDGAALEPTIRNGNILNGRPQPNAWHTGHDGGCCLLSCLVPSASRKKLNQTVCRWPCIPNKWTWSNELLQRFR
jgi:hypothetical protein